MSLIRCMRTFYEARREFVKLTQFRKQSERLLGLYDFEDKHTFLRAIDEQIHNLEKELNAFIEFQNVEVAANFIAIEELPQTLLRLRIWLGWSQAELGKNAGINAKSIHAYERDKYLKTRLEKIVRITNALKQGLIEKAAAEARRSRFGIATTAAVQCSDKLTYEGMLRANDEDAEFVFADGVLSEPPYEAHELDYENGLLTYPEP